MYLGLIWEARRHSLLSAVARDVWSATSVLPLLSDGVTVPIEAWIWINRQVQILLQHFKKYGNERKFFEGGIVAQ